MPQQVSDPVVRILRRAPANDAVRADAWDAFESARDADDLAVRLQAIKIPDSVKAELWDLKAGAALAPTPPRRTHTTESGLASMGEILAAKPEGSAARRFLSNAGEMLNPVTIATGLYDAVRHPIKTVENVGAASADQLRKAGQRIDEGRYVDAVGHGLGALPLVGPAAVAAGEQIASGDVAGGLGKAFGLLAPSGAPSAIRAARAAASKAPGVATALEAGAASRVADVISPKVGQNKVRIGNRAEKIAPALAKDLAKNGAPFTRGAMHAEIKTKLVAAEQALDEASDARLSARTFETAPLIEALQQKRQALSAEAVVASKIKPKVTEPPPSANWVDGMETGPADRNFIIGWLADDLREMPFQKGGSTKRSRDEHAANWQAGDDGAPGMVMNGHVAGTPTLEMFHAAGITGSRAAIAHRLEKFAAGKKADPKLEALAEAMAEAWDGQRFDFDLVSQAALRKTGLRKTTDLRSPITMPHMEKYPREVVSRFFPEDFSDGAPLDLGMPQVIKEGRPLGRNVVPAPNSARVAMIDQAIADIKRLGPVARYEPIRTLRQAYDEPAKAVYSPAVTPDFLKAKGSANGAADVTGVLREALAKWDPETAQANAQYSLYRSADDVLKATAEVERTRPKVGRQIIARMTGTILGGQQAGLAGAAVGYVAGPIVDSALASGMTTQLKTAALMQRLATAIRKGDVGFVNSLTSQIKRLGATAGASLNATNPNESRTNTAPLQLAPSGGQ